MGASEQERPDVQQARASFQDWAKTTDPRRLIFVDEFGAKLGMTPLYGYAPSGERAYGKAPDNADPNLTLLLGLEMQGVGAPVVFEGAINRPRFETYAREFLGPVLRPGDVVLVDRIKPHLYPEVRAAIEGTGVEFHPLPP